MASFSSTVSSQNSKPPPHAVCIPYPAQGHLIPMLKLAMTLHSSGFHITFLNTEFIHNRLLNSGALISLTNIPRFCFQTFPDGIPPPPPGATVQDPFLVCEASQKNFLAPLRRLITSLDREAVVSCVISDGLMPFNVGIARDLGVPGMLLWLPNPCAFMGYKYHRCLKENGLIPPREEQLDMIVDLIPGLKNVRLRDIPHVNISHYDFPMREAEAAFQASGIIFNTFEAMEKGVLDAIKSMFPHVYAIGPLQLVLNSTATSATTTTGNNLKPSLSFNLYPEESHCLKWLDSMNPNSVVYISFGSTVVMTPHQFTEFAWGILNSDRPFLWIIRPDLVKGESQSQSQSATQLLPLEVLEKVKEQRGLIATWCPQEEVLSHPSVGGFVTHFGANSVLESICAGVPMIGRPFFGDQQVNCRYSCDQWGIGMEINEDIEREGVEGLVRDLMEGEKGIEMKRKVMDWRKLAVEATSPGGSSLRSLDNLVKALSGSQENVMGGM